MIGSRLRANPILRISTLTLSGDDQRDSGKGVAEPHRFDILQIKKYVVGRAHLALILRMALEAIPQNHPSDDLDRACLQRLQQRLGPTTQERELLGRIRYVDWEVASSDIYRHMFNPAIEQDQVRCTCSQLVNKTVDLPPGFDQYRP